MLKQLVQSLAGQVAAAMNVRMVYGEPISAEGKTIIPVAKVAGGFGAGTGPEDETEAAEGEHDTAGKSGAGGGFAAKPIGLIEVTPQRTRFIPIGNRGTLWAAAAGGFVLGVLLFRRRR